MQIKHLVLSSFIAICASAHVGYVKAKTEAELLGWLVDMPAPWALTEESLGKVLPKFHQQFPDYDERLRALSYWRLGTPYKIFNLGEEQAPDVDPVFRMDVSDCTSHVLTTMALAESQSWSEARETLIRIHYKPDAQGDKKPVYHKRWHYTSDRLLHHPMTPQVTSDYIDESRLKTVSVHLNKKQDGSEFLDLNWSMPVTVSYIPSENVTKELIASLPDMIGVAFVKESYFKMGVVMAHEGMIMDGMNLLHAGQVAEETVIEDFMKYYFPEKGPRFDGIMLYDLRPLG